MKSASPFHLHIGIPTIGRLDYLDETIKTALQVKDEVPHCTVTIYNFSKTKLSIEENVNFSINNVDLNNINLAICWNYILQNTQEEWLILLHDDDILQVNGFKDFNYSSDISQYGAIVGNYFLIDSSSQKINKSNNKIYGSNLSLGDTPKFCSTIYNVKKLKMIGGWDMKYGYGLDIVPLIKLEKTYGFFRHESEMGSYRIHNSNTFKENTYHDYCSNFSTIYQDIIDYMDPQEELSLFINKFFKFALSQEKSISFFKKFKLRLKKLLLSRY
jgi:hypothetical protein